MTTSRFLARGRAAGIVLLISGLISGLAACGNAVSATEAGLLGITVDRDGNPVAVVMSCSTATPVIDLSEGRTAAMPGNQPNVHRGTWSASTPFAGVQRVNLTQATEGWVQSGSPGTLQSDRLFVLTGGTTQDDDAYLGQVSFRTPDLAGLSPEKIRIEGKVETVAEFNAYTCQ